MTLVQVMEIAILEIGPMTQDQSGVADAQSTQRPRTIAGQPGAERLWTPAPADHVAASVVGGHAEPIAIRPWQGFAIAGIVHIAGGRDWVFDASDPAADAALLRSGRYGRGRS